MASDATPQQAQQSRQTEQTEPPEQPQTVRVERTRDEVVLRLPTLSRLLRAVLPPEAVEHLYAAQREQLLAARAVIDAALARLEQAQRTERSQTPRRTEIEVE